jgi:CheY-like chemotaxis protein
VSEKPKILVIDDERAVRNGLQKVLEQAGCDVTTAASGSEGPEALAATFLNRNGFDACAQLKKTPTLSQVPVVFISRSVDEESRRLGIEVGGVDFMTKPFLVRDFIPRILACMKKGTGPDRIKLIRRGWRDSRRNPGGRGSTSRLELPRGDARKTKLDNRAGCKSWNVLKPRTGLSVIFMIFPKQRHEQIAIMQSGHSVRLSIS